MREKDLESGGLITLTTFAGDTAIHMRTNLGPCSARDVQPVWKFRVWHPDEGWISIMLPDKIGSNAIREDGYLNAIYPKDEQNVQVFTVMYTPNFRVATELIPETRELLSTFRR